MAQAVQNEQVKKQKTNIIGVIIPKINSISIGIKVSGILEVLNDRGYSIMINDTQDDRDKEVEALKTMQSSVDGIIFLASDIGDMHTTTMALLDVPVLIMGQQIPGYSCVYNDDYKATYDMTRIILDKGRTKLGFISAPHIDQAVGVARFKGYCDAVNAAGYPELKERYVISEFQLRGGYESVHRLLDKYPDTDAIVCATDTIAVGSIMALKAMNISVPDQIMISGQGDSDMGRTTVPALTTVHYAHRNGGRTAARMLLDIIEGVISIPKEVKIGYNIEERESTGVAHS